MSMAQVVTLVGVNLLGAMSPGPDFVIVTRNAALSGRRAGIACTLGVAGGVFAWSVVTALGVAGLLAASAVAFTAVKLAGAGYLLLLGIRALLAARRGGDAAPPAPELPRPRGAAVAFRQGLLTNLLNPKTAVFFIALIPQFLPDDPTALDTLVLGAIGATVALVWFTVVSTLVGAIRTVFTRARVRRVIDAVMGTLLVGIGVRIAVESR